MSDLTPEQQFELHKQDREFKVGEAKLLHEEKFEREKIDRDQSFDARHEYARQILALRLQYEQHLKEYGQLALRTLFLLNGGAVIALLAFIGTALGKEVAGIKIVPALFVPALFKFFLALVFVTLSLATSYLNYSFQHSITAHPADLANNMIRLKKEWPGQYTPVNLRGTTITWIVAMAFGVASGVLFAWGCFNISHVLSGLGAVEPTTSAAIPLARIFTTIGLVVEIIGAALLAFGLFVSKTAAIELSVSRYVGETEEENLKQPQVRDRLKQSRFAMVGLSLIVVGFVCQIIAAWQ